MVAVAIGGAAVLGAGATMIAGSKSAKAQKQAAQESAAVERYIYDQTRSDNQPQRIVGESALYKLADLYGVQRPTNMQSVPQGQAPMNALVSGGGMGGFLGAAIRAEGGYPKGQPQTGMELTEGGGDFFTSPGYQFRMEEGINALDRSAAARGRLLSGAQSKALTRYGQGVASEEFGNYTNALRTMAGQGQVANAANQQAGQQYAAGTTNALTNAGNARASSYANMGSAINSGINNALTGYLYNSGGGAGYSSPSLGIGNNVGVVRPF